MKSDEFTALAKVASPGIWQQSYYVPGPSVNRLNQTIEEKVRAESSERAIVRGAGQIGSPGCNLRFALLGPDSTPENVAFIVWCANNRDTIARALRRDEVVERPTQALCADLGAQMDMIEAFAGGSTADESVRGSEAIAIFRSLIK